MKVEVTLVWIPGRYEDSTPFVLGFSALLILTGATSELAKIAKYFPHNA